MSCRSCPYLQRLSGVISGHEYWCDKVGGEIWKYGTCDEEDDIVAASNGSKQKRRTKRERDYKYKQHLKYLSDNCQWYPSPAYPVNKYGESVCTQLNHHPRETDKDNDIAYYKRQYKDNHKTGRYGYYKRYSNRKIRRYKGEIKDGRHYRKCFDLWWNAY